MINIFTAFTFYKEKRTTTLCLLLTLVCFSINKMAFATEFGAGFTQILTSMPQKTELPPSIEYFRLGSERRPVHVYRVDPLAHDFKLYNVSEINSLHHLNLFSLRDLGQKQELQLAFPASMYREDYITSISYMKNYTHVNNGKFTSAYQAVLLFNPKRKNIDRVKIVYRRDSNFQAVISQYNTAISLMRMISRGKSIEWKQAYGNIVSVGVDDEGKFLVVFSFGHRTVSSLIDIMLNANQFNIEDLLYVEGGSKGGIFVGPNEGFGYQGYLPNIIGIL